MTPPSKNDTLLYSTIAACVAVIIILFVILVVVAVVFIRLVRRGSSHIPQNLELYADIENLNPIYEAVDKDLSCNCADVSKSETELSYVDMCGAIAPDPLYDTADHATTQFDTKMATKQLEAKEKTPTLDKTLKEDTGCYITNHYQNVSDEYSNYSNVPHATR